MSWKSKYAFNTEQIMEAASTHTERQKEETQDWKHRLTTQSGLTYAVHPPIGSLTH
jgi:hypothetical protein